MELPLSHHIGETDYGEKSHLVRSNGGMHLLTKPSRELYIYIYISTYVIIELFNKIILTL